MLTCHINVVNVEYVFKLFALHYFCFAPTCMEMPPLDPQWDSTFGGGENTSCCHQIESHPNKK